MADAYDYTVYINYTVFVFVYTGRQNLICQIHTLLVIVTKLRLVINKSLKWLQRIFCKLLN